MFKTSLITRLITIAVLLTFLLGSFPTAASAAKSNGRGLDAKWAKLVDNYYRQASMHNSVHHWVQLWRLDNNKAPAYKKAELQRDLAKFDAAWGPAPIIVMRHSGFDAGGNVVDKAAAKQSISDLSRALQRHNRAMKNLRSFLRLYSTEG